LAAFAAEAAAKAQESAVATKERPAALRAKGIDDNAPPLTYTGPSEDGSAAVQRSSGAAKPAAPSGASRRERREAARQQAREAKDSRRS
jgi:preprotein translocase subunit SecA